MRVWLITVGEPLPTEKGEKRPWRTGIIARKLAERGHDVVWWTSTVNHFDKTLHETANALVPVQPNLSVQFLHGRRYRKNVSLDRFINHVEIGRAFTRLAKTAERPDIILCSLPTLELSDAAARYGQYIGIPVLLDVRDLWPDEFVKALPRQVRSAGKFIFAPMFGQARRALRRATGIIAVSQTYLDWAHRISGRVAGPYDRVFTHGYPIEPVADEAPGDDAEHLRAMGIDPNKRGFWFIGTFVGSIDLSTVIAAARRLQHRHDTQVIISGAGQDEERYRQEAFGLDNVVFTGWVDRTNISIISRHAYAGLGAYKPGALMSLTNKVFEYLAAGTPILLALPGEAEEIVVGNGCGLAYEPGNSASLAEAMLTLLDHPEQRHSMSENARMLFETRFSADRIYDEMVALLEEVGGAIE